LKKLIYLLLLIYFGKNAIAAGPDSLIFYDFPDVYDTDLSFWDEFIPTEAKSWYRIRKKSSQRDYFNQYFRIELPERFLFIHNDQVWNEKPMKSWNSSKLQLGMWHFYYGYGSIKLGQGYYFGDEFGKMSVSNTQNLSSPQIKIAMKPYSSYGEIRALAYENEAIHITIFDRKDSYGTALNLKQKNWNAGAGLYNVESPVMDLWGEYHPTRFFRVGGSSSFRWASWEHIAAEFMAEPENGLRLFLLGMGTSDDFHSQNGDLRWGGRPQPGSQGIGTGIRWQLMPRLNYEIFLYRFNKLALETDEQFHQLAFRLDDGEIQFRFRHSTTIAKIKSQQFPYLLEMEETERNLVQIKMALRLGKMIIINNGADFFLWEQAATALWVRAERKSSWHRLRLQWSRGYSHREHPLYLLRINSGGTYRIQSIRQSGRWLDAEWLVFYQSLSFSLLASHSQKETELQMQMQIALNN